MKKKKQQQKESEDLFAVGSFQLRICFLVLFTFVLFAILVIRLWSMQIVRHDEYVFKDEKQSARRIRVPAMRGAILSNDGTELVRNRPSFNVLFHPAEVKVKKAGERAAVICSSMERVAKFLDRVSPLTVEKITQHLNLRPGLPLTVFSDLTAQEVGRISDIYPPIPGLEVVAEPMREYPFGSMAAHILGYVGSEDPASAEDRKEYFYYLGGLRGREGLERKYDERLSGKAGSRLVMVNSNGFIFEELEAPEPAQNGFDLQLTIDVNAQKAAETAMAGHNAAMVIMDASSGAVLAMASMPNYSPSDFVPSISHTKFREIRDDPRNPFLNRALMGSYMPGSIIKPLLALAALENGISADRTVNCEGHAHYGYKEPGIRCTARYGHGPLNVREAIMRSCNAYFVDIGVEIGIDAVSRVYKSAGIGSKTGIELPERSGVLPHNGPSWNQNETGYVSIGQGQVEVTPLQAARYYSAIANGGTLYKPYLVSHIYDHDHATGKTVSIFDAKPEITGRLAASSRSLDIVREGMYMVTHENAGTGKRANLAETDVFGKTGTADVTLNDGTATKNTWFAGFAEHPVTHRLFSFALVVEQGQSGSGTSAPIVAQALQDWFAASKAAQ